MTDENRDPKPKPDGSDCEDVTEAAEGAEQLISRLQNIMTDTIAEGDPEDGFNDMVSELDPGAEAVALRKALGLGRHGTRGVPDDPAEPGPDHGDTASPEDAPPEYRTWRTGP